MLSGSPVPPFSSQVPFIIGRDRPSTSGESQVRAKRRGQFLACTTDFTSATVGFLQPSVLNLSAKTQIRRCAGVARTA